MSLSCELLARIDNSQLDFGLRGSSKAHQRPKQATSNDSTRPEPVIYRYSRHRAHKYSTFHRNFSGYSHRSGTPETTRCVPEAVFSRSKLSQPERLSPGDSRRRSSGLDRRPDFFHLRRRIGLGRGLERADDSLELHFRLSESRPRLPGHFDGSGSSYERIL